MTNEIRNKIIKGLIAFGVRSGTVYFIRDNDRVTVSVNNKYFGLWDINKSTFVD